MSWASATTPSSSIRPISWSGSGLKPFSAERTQKPRLPCFDDGGRVRGRGEALREGAVQGLRDVQADGRADQLQEDQRRHRQAERLDGLLGDLDRVSSSMTIRSVAMWSGRSPRRW
jgi:hypothetical protein